MKSLLKSTLYHEDLKRFQITHLHHPDGRNSLPLEVEERFQDFSAWDRGDTSEGVSSLCWEKRVMVTDDRCGAGMLIHEVVHLLLDQPPGDMQREGFTWMYAAERSLARRWGALWEWETWMMAVPVDDPYDGNHKFFENFSLKDQRRMMRDWYDMLRDAGLMRHNHFINPGTWKGQTSTSLPRGCFEVIDSDYVRDPYGVERMLP